MPSAVIVDVVRTPVGKKNGRLSGWHAVDLAAQPLRALVERNDLDPALVEDVVFGCTMTVGEQAMNIGRNAALAAGFPDTVPGTTVDRQCGSAQQAVHFAAQAVDVGGDGHRHRRRRRGDEPGADRLDHRARAGRGLRADRARPVRLHPPGPLRRGDRPSLGDRPGGHGPVRPPLPRTGRPGDRRGPLRERDRAAGHPPGARRGQGGAWPAPTRATRPARARLAFDEGVRAGLDLRQAGVAPTVLRRGRPGDRGIVVADLRRGGRRADHVRGAGRPARARARGPGSTPSPWPPTTR